MENFGFLTDLGIYFQEAVLSSCDKYGIDANNLTESDWNLLYSQLSELSFKELVYTAMDVASKRSVTRTL